MEGIQDGEKRLTPRQLAGMLPTKKHSATIRKWIRRGIVNRRTSTVHKLEGVYEGGELFTTYEAYLRFREKMNSEP